MKTGKKLAIWAVVIGFGLIVWGAIVEAGNEIDFMDDNDCWTKTITCDKGNKYMTVYANPGTTSDSLYILRTRHGVVDTLYIETSSIFPAAVTFWIADASQVVVEKDGAVKVTIIRRTER